MINYQEIQTIEFALCYLLSNCDDEIVREHFEMVTNSEEPEKWVEYISHAIMEILKQRFCHKK